MSYTKPLNYQERPIVIIGAGTLGMRIALMMATQGGEVRIFDFVSQQRNKAYDFIQNELPHVLARFPGGCQGRVELFDDLSKAVENAWIVFEVVPELLEKKREVFCELGRLAPVDAILASNSSSFPCSQFIDQLNEDVRARIVNTHFYMPPVQNAVEIMGCCFTDPAIIDTLMDVLPTYGGLVPFVVRKESVGFIFNRVWAAIKRECLDVVATGVSTPEDVDRIFMVNTGVTMGPFREMDQIGLDVILEIEEHYAELNPSLPAAPRILLRKYISEGKLGVKSGCGFYTYPV
jgi:3-hydroxybutyryl-CoA dehydrogenase